MNNFYPRFCMSRRRRQGGVSLIIVLIMVVIIGLTSAAAIRNATSDERVTNNMRMQSLAQQYAEAALRYCEAELAKADAARVATLQEANIVTTAFEADPAWNRTDTWLGGGGASATLTVLPELQIKSSNSAFKPSTLPQCVAEKQALKDTNIVYVITARGFSPDYTANAGTGKTTGGSVVWLQSTLALN
ncbi:MAG: hypothetical protein M3Q12_09745 [Pseudomonadota bacterium]|uniref:pilus assembly PilX family protein n=1 Tax=Polaromonas sp. TaxID=1869339 RepID=UPI0017E07FEE|nr:PilX N-terminal domain-containing pilus assembly protein [Polaromonas sp.]MBA3593848.1 hypothetical protein [Polaromonas sp.]MDQ3272431.1 hypothetical protein [Pseudomonadota bacterium]